MSFNSAIDSIRIILDDLENYVSKAFTGAGHDSCFGYLIMSTVKVKTCLVAWMRFSIGPLTRNYTPNSFRGEFIRITAFRDLFISRVSTLNQDESPVSTIFGVHIENRVTACA